jgi:hypothetical protein
MTDSPCVTVRDMLTDLLYARCHEAMRMPQVVGNETYVTSWDKAHTAINELLDTLVGR